MPLDQNKLKRLLESREKVKKRMQTDEFGKQDSMLMQSLLGVLMKQFELAKGEKGDKPIAGVDYPIPKDGKDGYTPQAGKDYMREPRDGAKGDKGDRGDVGPRGPKGEKGQRGPKGKDADIKKVLPMINTANKLIMEQHNKKYDHDLLHDSKILGSLELDEESLKDGSVLQIKDRKLVAVPMPTLDAPWMGRSGAAHSRYKIQTVTASASIDPQANVVLVDASGGDITLTLYEAAGQEGTYTYFKRVDDTLTNSVTFATPNSETLEFETAYRLVNEGSGCEIFSDGTNFLIKHA